MKKASLKPVERKVEVVVAAKHDPKEFFQDRKGLYVYPSFADNVLSKAEPTEAGASFKIASFELVKSASDEEIENTLSEGHSFSETEVCAIVASLIEKQPEGEEGVLLNNGYANIFYTPSCVVFVYWNANDRFWSVDGWDRDSGWHGGFRVFSPENYRFLHF